MSLLEKLWDDTVAGPYPDSGLGKLRKYSAFNSRSNSGREASGNQRSYGDASGGGASGNDDMKVTRSIMIVRPPQADQKDSPPASPAGSTPPLSPFAGLKGKEPVLCAGPWLGQLIYDHLGMARQASLSRCVDKFTQASELAFPDCLTPIYSACIENGWLSVFCRYLIETQVHFLGPKGLGDF